MQKKRIWGWAPALAVLAFGLFRGAAWAGTASPVPPDKASEAVSDVLAYTTDARKAGDYGAPLVKVTLNDGTPATFMLDTGTSQCAVTDTMAAKLHLTPQPLAQSASPLIMDGTRATSVPLTLQVGRFRFPHFPTLVIKGSRFEQVLGHPLDGILGINLLQHFALILSPQSHVLTIISPGKLTAAQMQSWGFRRASALPLTRADNGTFFAPISLANGGRTAQENLAVDTGAGTSVLSYAVAQSLGLTPLQEGLTVPFGNGAFVGNIARVPTVTLGTVPSGTSAAPSTLTWRDGAFLYSSRPEATVGSPHVLGMNILAECSVLLDFPGAILYLQPLQTSP